MQCERIVLLLNYRPNNLAASSIIRKAESAAGREGIEPSLRVLEARPVTMTLQPMSAPYGNRTRLKP